MGRILGDKDAVEAHKSARQALEEYSGHQREQEPRGRYETDEYLRLNSRVIETEQHVPRWRR
jgi:hypothetical protein